jgi:glutamate/tyrosine decarboxylase-like PLP-dependent enzyme
MSHEPDPTMTALATGGISPLDLPADEFRRLGHRLVDQLADHLDGIRTARTTDGKTPGELRAILGGDRALPATGTDADELLARATQLVLDHSLYLGHPLFLGYVVGSPAPIGALGDLLASTINPNVGGFSLAPIATEMERQTVRWIAELIGYDPACGGLLVSGGNMANFIGFLAGRRAILGAELRTAGLPGQRTLVYATEETHTWIDKATDLFGMGTDSVRRVPRLAVPAGHPDFGVIDVDALRAMIREDRLAGHLPMMIVGNAGTVSTGALDPLDTLADIAAAESMWFHVDGAYGGFAACLPEAPARLKAISRADSVAIDPHKWLSVPIECGCVLVRTPDHLVDTFSYRPPYYHRDESDDVSPIYYYEIGPQNSRGFRALKTWLALQQAGRTGYEAMIRENCRLAGVLFEAAGDNPELETFTLGLSIATFRYVPRSFRDPAAPGPKAGTSEGEAALNGLNARLVERLQAGPEAFVSNAVINGMYVLRACCVNFRTTEEDMRRLPEIVARTGRALAL